MSTTEFLGAGMPGQAYDELAFKFIRADWRGCELDLFASKWFDYRLLHPTEATYLYAHHYILEFRSMFRANFDVMRAEYHKVFASTNVFRCDKATVAGLWRGRQVADAHGIPYDVFVRLALKELMRYWKQKHMPRPMHLYADETVANVMMAWDELQAARLYYSSEPVYQAGNWQDLGHQRDHHAWLVKQAQKRPSSMAVLRRFLTEGLLDGDRLRALFPERANEILAIA